MGLCVIKVGYVLNEKGGMSQYLLSMVPIVRCQSPFCKSINITCTVLQDLLHEEIGDNILSTHLPRGSLHLSRRTVTLCSKGVTDCGTFDLYYFSNLNNISIQLLY